MNREEFDSKMQKLVMFRGTKEEIISEFEKIGNRTDPYFLEPFENSIEGNDYGYNTNIGNIGDEYLDYEIFLLNTNVDNQYLITEINPF